MAIEHQCNQLYQFQEYFFSGRVLSQILNRTDFDSEIFRNMILIRLISLIKQNVIKILPFVIRCKSPPQDCFAGEHILLTKCKQQRIVKFSNKNRTSHQKLGEKAQIQLAITDKLQSTFLLLHLKQNLFVYYVSYWQFSMPLNQIQFLKLSCMYHHKSQLTRLNISSFEQCTNCALQLNILSFDQISKIVINILIQLDFASFSTQHFRDKHVIKHSVCQQYSINSISFRFIEPH